MSRSSLDHPFAAPPAPAEVTEVAPGIRWIRMPLPFALDHINLWLLEDECDGEPGYTIIDCGLADDETRDAWSSIIEKQIGSRPVRRVVVTHYHPDHAGLASWLINRFRCPIWMTQAEFLTAHLIFEGHGSYVAGEETAMLESMQGRPAMPRQKPPFYPTDFGL